MSHHIYFRILGYIITIGMHIFNIVYMIKSFQGEPMKNAYVRHFSEMQCFFFTCWTFTFQTVYAVVALFSDILTLKNPQDEYELSKPLVLCRDALFSIFVWPSTVLVFSLFWSIFHYDRSLIFPEDIDLVITNTSNHIMHTYILPATLWEIMFRSRKPPKTHIWHVLGVFVVAVVYFRVVFFVHTVWGVWVYPIFGVLNGSIYIYLFMAMVIAVLPLIYYSQWILSSMVWGSRESKKKLY